MQNFLPNCIINAGKLEAGHAVGHFKRYINKQETNQDLKKMITKFMKENTYERLV